MTTPRWNRLLVAALPLLGLLLASEYGTSLVRPATGQERNRIWDGELPAQPFDMQPLSRVRVPAWVGETIGCGYTLSAMDSPAREAAARHGVTLSEMGFVDPFYAYYDSRLLRRRSPHVPLSRLAHDLAEYQRLGVRVLAVYPPTLQSEVYEAHPDWRRVATDTREIPQVDLQKHPYGGMLCPLGPYGDFFIEVLAEIATQFPAVAAFSFDGLHHGGVCYCQHCRDNYRRTTGAEIPPADLNRAEFRRYQHWADRRLEDLVRRLQQRLKGIRPELALVTWSTNAGRWGHFLSLPRNMPARLNLLFDAPDQEFWMDESNRGNTILPAFTNAYLWGLTDHRTGFSEPYLMSHGNPYGKDSFPPHEIERRMMLTLTYGAAPSIAVAQPPRLQQEVYRCLDEVQRRKPWLTHKRPEPWAALLVSDNTRTFYGREPGRVEERYLAHLLGTFRTCVEAHLPVALINDWNLTPDGLAPYATLLLPNAACLDSAQVRAIDQFVRQGGGLVASLDASRFDEFGEARDAFALADLLGVDYRGPAPDEPQAARDQPLDENFARSIGPDFWEKRRHIFDFRLQPDTFLDRGTLAAYVGHDPVTFKGPAVHVLPRPGTQTLATLQGRTPGAPVLPAILSRSHGQGRVVYSAASLDAAYYLYSYPYQRCALEQAIRWTARRPPPVEVAAPRCVHVTIMHQERDDQRRLIVHLFNDINTTGGHALPVDDVPLREEVLPIHGIRVTFAPEYRLGRVTLEPEGIPLQGEATAAGYTVVVPRLDIHSLVVAEWPRSPAP